MIYDVIIIGGGPAGITAGIYSARKKLKTLLITKDFSGQIARKTLLVENYPGIEKISGKELIQKFQRHLEKQEVEIEIDEVLKVSKSEEKFTVFTKKGNNFLAKAVIIASGADPKFLKIPGEKEFLGKGVSYCATCDSPIFKNKTVAVIGGGNAGFEEAIALSKWADKVYLLIKEEVIIADEIIQQAVKAIAKIQVITSVIPKEIKGGKFVNSIIYQEVKSKKIVELKIDGVFVSVGVKPATFFVKDLVSFSKLGEIIVNFQTGETKIPGLFAAGDVDNFSYRQIVIAAGEGAKAALSAYKYLQRK